MAKNSTLPILFALFAVSGCCTSESMTIREAYPHTANRFDNDRPVLRVSSLTEDERLRLPSEFISAFEKGRLFVMFDDAGEISICRPIGRFGDSNLYPSKIRVARSEEVEEINRTAEAAGLLIHQDPAWPQFTYYALPSGSAQSEISPVRAFVD